MYKAGNVRVESIRNEPRDEFKFKGSKQSLFTSEGHVQRRGLMNMSYTTNFLLMQSIHAGQWQIFLKALLKKKQAFEKKTPEIMQSQEDESCPLLLFGALKIHEML